MQLLTPLALPAHLARRCLIGSLLIVAIGGCSPSDAPTVQASEPPFSEVIGPTPRSLAREADAQGVAAGMAAHLSSLQNETTVVAHIRYAPGLTVSGLGDLCAEYSLVLVAESAVVLQTPLGTELVLPTLGSDCGPGLRRSLTDRITRMRPRDINLKTGVWFDSLYVRVAVVAGTSSSLASLWDENAEAVQFVGVVGTPAEFYPWIPTAGRGVFP